MAPDVQHNNLLCLYTKPRARYCLNITKNNLIPFSIYFSVRLAIKATWLNDRDQFLYPNNLWECDFEFQYNCLIFMLFHSQNRIKSSEGTNYLIPFSESEIGAKEAFESDFLAKFLNGKINDKNNSLIEHQSFIPKHCILEHLSSQARAVYNAGKEIYKYYHAQNSKIINNASLYEIKEFFCKRKENKNGKLGKLESKSQDKNYNILMDNLKLNMQDLARAIEPKIYEYGFLAQ